VTRRQAGVLLLPRRTRYSSHVVWYRQPPLSVLNLLREAPAKTARSQMAFSASTSAAKAHEEATRALRTRQGLMTSTPPVKATR
jgi:hypothetical protein